MLRLDEQREEPAPGCSEAVGGAVRVEGVGHVNRPGTTSTGPEPLTDPDKNRRAAAQDSSLSTEHGVETGQDPADPPTGQAHISLCLTASTRRFTSLM